MKHNTVQKKFIKQWDVNDFQILTDDGFVDVKKLGKTIPYIVYYIETENGKQLWCADNHIIFDGSNNEKFVKELNVGEEILTNNGLSKVTKINKFSKEENMYDFELCDNSRHRYYTNGILSHNTLLAKTLAKEIFGDEKYLIRFDMSEYNDKTSVNKLIGASAGYVGYNEGGLLTESVKRNKYAVLLIDEIEKATEEIYNLFLQVFDEGFLTDNTGQKVDFKNTIIILTSNVGTKKAGQHKALGFAATEDSSVKHGIIEKEIKDKFPPEFINRLDEIVYFNNLDEDNLKEIIKLEMKKLEDRVKNVGYSISYDDNVIDFLLNRIKDEKEYGARPIIRTIRDNIENKITDLIIDNFNPNVIFSITVDGDEIKVEETVNIVFDKENNVYKIV